MQIKQQEQTATNGEVNDDSYHLGNFFMDYMIQFPEDHAWQIDAATGETESKLSVKSRSIRLARCLRNAGLQPGDVVVVSGRNHLDVHIPFYAAYLNGLPLAGVDPLYKYEEIKLLFNTTKPKIAFCEVENFGEYDRAAKDLGLNVKLVTFGGGENSFAKFMKNYDDRTPEEDFKVATFDTDKVYAWLISTSGTTGLPKVAAFKHQHIIKILRLYTLLKQKKIEPALNLSSVQWISSYLASLSMITANHIKVQTSSPVTIEHAIDIINKYRPVVSTGSPNLFAGLIKHPKHCDLTSFNTIVITGSSINETILNLIKSRMRKDAAVWNLFAQTECVGPIFLPAPNGPVGNVGTDLDLVKTQLVDPKTGAVITEPNKVGELWSKGPRFVEYYNNPEATAKAFSADGWYKTGDLLYKDENGYHFFVERMSSAFKYRRYYRHLSLAGYSRSLKKSLHLIPKQFHKIQVQSAAEKGYPPVMAVVWIPPLQGGTFSLQLTVQIKQIQVMPMEIEQLIRTHPGVLDVCVLGVPHPEDGKQAVAVVMRAPGSTVTEEEIKTLVADKLSIHKHLHGGLVFVNDFPRTISGKIARAKVRDMIVNMRKTGDEEYPNVGNVKKLINTFQQLSSPINSRAQR